MTPRNRTLGALSVLLPAGVLGTSALLASAPAEALVKPVQSGAASTADGSGIAARLRAIRGGVSALAGDAARRNATRISKKVWWGNGGWGWHRGWGWHNGGWGWHNGGFGWGNGGWGNGGWGWHNGGWGNGGWHNFWHNW
ncbi:MAG: hypothetical protein WDN04_23485 [Rhodospirillales bacterium]